MLWLSHLIMTLKNKNKMQPSVLSTWTGGLIHPKLLGKQPSGMYKYGKCIEQGNSEQVNIAQTKDKMAVLRAKVMPGP